MMRLLKIFSLVALVIAVGLFGAAEVTAYLNQDNTLPEISAGSEVLEIPCAYTQEQLLEGVTASDGRDGDLTSQILVGDFSRFIEPGVCDLSYVVFDSSQHMDTLTRRVIFTDYHSPRFALADTLCFEAGSTNNTEVRALFSASDLLDGDLTSWITYEGTTASYSIPGNYTITMEVRNSFGDTVSYDFPIHIYEQDSHWTDIRLTEPLVYVEQGEYLDPYAYIESVVDQTGTRYDVSQVEIDSNLNPSVPGLYEIHYQFQQEGDPLFGETWLTVIVQEVTP